MHLNDTAPLCHILSAACHKSPSPRLHTKVAKIVHPRAVSLLEDIRVICHTRFSPPLPYQGASIHAWDLLTPISNCYHVLWCVNGFEPNHVGAVPLSPFL